MRNTAFIGVVAAAIAIALLAGVTLGVRYERNQRPQPCYQTYTQGEGIRHCILDPRDGAWVK